MSLRYSKQCVALIKACLPAEMQPTKQQPGWNPFRACPTPPRTHPATCTCALKPPAACPPATNLTNNTPLCANHRYPGQHRTRTRFANLLLLCQKHAPGSHTTKHRPTPRNRHRSLSSVACRRRLCRRGPERFAAEAQTSTTNTCPSKTRDDVNDNECHAKCFDNVECKPNLSSSDYCKKM